MTTARTNAEDALSGNTANAFDVTDLNRVRQARDRAAYDKETVYAILDAGLVAHVAFVDQGRPVVIPMIYGRDGDRLFLHGARKGRFASTTAGEPVSIGVTLVDGIVVARSMFDASMNYRSVVIHGRAAEIDDIAARLHALKCVSEHNLPGRWNEVRAPLDKELKATVVIEVTVEAAAAKIRRGPANDSAGAGVDENVWAGVVPVTTVIGEPEVDSSVPAGVPVPASLSRIRKG